ncbi:uncharacterized protein EI90DRAFT_3029603 [Cantharellus anzutake]|uniref:uncharacterized protein n=1 Tax=Cantharellus anzutake TaxID=1750568 RepID=UPI001908E7FA|nr:uncharacterized protein EI90DRAFT_3029603 [Cantharellus anzutake]KAF8342615.1 hypothetical protein EI90DRAFT_3029603 [Cantharellus anzutake]
MARSLVCIFPQDMSANSLEALSDKATTASNQSINQSRSPLHSSPLALSSHRHHDGVTRRRVTKIPPWMNEAQHINEFSNSQKLGRTTNSAGSPTRVAIPFAHVNKKRTTVAQRSNTAGPSHRIGEYRLSCFTDDVRDYDAKKDVFCQTVPVECGHSLSPPIAVLSQSDSSSFSEPDELSSPPPTGGAWSPQIFLSSRRSRPSSAPQASWWNSFINSNSSLGQ